MATQVSRTKVVEQPSQPRKTKTSFMKKYSESGALPYLMVIPALLVIVVVAVYPILDSVRMSFLQNPLARFGTTFVGIANYVTVLSDPTFQQAIGVTLLFLVLSVALETFFGLLIALLINKTFPGRGLVRAAILVPWAFPTVVSAQMWLLMYNDQTGIITYVLQQMNLLGTGESLINSQNGVLTAMVITDVWKTTPFMALLILAGLQVIPNELYEAASVDGSNKWQQFWSITLPQLKDPLLIALLFRCLDAVRVFDLAYVFGQRSVQTMATYSNFKMFASIESNFSTGVAAAVIIFIVGIIISLIFVSMMRNVMSQM